MRRFFNSPAWLLAGATLMLAACASTPEVDPRQIQQAEEAIRDAREVADRHAPPALTRAEETLNAARRRIDAGDNDEARRLLEQAQVLAQRAEHESLAAQSAQALTEIEANLAALQRQIESGPRGSASPQPQ